MKEQNERINITRICKYCDYTGTDFVFDDFDNDVCILCPKCFSGDCMDAPIPVGSRTDTLADNYTGYYHCPECGELKTYEEMYNIDCDSDDICNDCQYDNESIIEKERKIPVINTNEPMYDLDYCTDDNLCEGIDY